MTTLNEVIETHHNLCAKAASVIEVKGHDYNRTQQADGDTLFNMQVSTLLGITDSPTQAILVRLSDKFMRLVSLTAEPDVDVKVKDEKIEDTICDSINYLVYLYCKYVEHRTKMMTDSLARKTDA